MDHIKVIGGGLSGSEAAWQIAESGIKVVLTEMRPKKTTKAHQTDLLAELVCSNSLRGAVLSNAVGLLKEELKLSGSLILHAALASQIPAGGALAVDRLGFSQYITEKINAHPLIEVVIDEVTQIPATDASSPAVIATGPLTAPDLAQAIAEVAGAGNLAFYDAISPVFTGDSLNYDVLFRQSRYDKGGDDYLNIPLSKDEYYGFVDQLLSAEKFGGHDEVESDCLDNLRPFEGCMPIEDMADRGPDTLAFGPMKPVGLTDPRTNSQPYAVIQLRQDDRAGTLWSMVGFQTKLTQPEQLRIFRALPGLENCEFVRMGSVHRNTFMDSPKCLDGTLELRSQPGLFFAGQVTGVEGYVESTAAGLLAGINAARRFKGMPLNCAPKSTALGGLINYISDPSREKFQPMNISFGLIESYVEPKGKRKRRSKRERREAIAKNALKELHKFAQENAFPHINDSIISELEQTEAEE